MNTLDLLDQYDIPYIREGKDVRQGWIGLSCVFCGHSGFYLGVNIAKGYGACWNCGPHSLASIISAVTGKPLRETIEATKGLARPLDAAERPAGKYKPPAGVGPLLPAHVRYLRDRRGFSPGQITDLVRLWGLGGIGIAPKLSWSLFIPITRYGVAVSWTTRTTGDGPKRYHGAGHGEESWPAKQWLLGLDLCRHAVAVVEGPLDAYRIGPGAAALMGIGHTPAQMRLIAEMPVRAICFDAEPKAQERARALADDLAAFPGRTAVVELDAADPGSAPPAEVAKLRAAFLD